MIIAPSARCRRIAIPRLAFEHLHLQVLQNTVSLDTPPPWSGMEISRVLRAGGVWMYVHNPEARTEVAPSVSPDR